MTRIMHGYRFFSDLLLLLIASLCSFSPCSPGQQIAEGDPDLTITTLTGPSAGTVTVADGKLWFCEKNKLTRLDPETRQLASIPVEEVRLGNWAIRNKWADCAVGGGSLWRLGQAHGVEGIHRTDLETGKCIATISLKMQKGITSLALGEGSLWVLNQHDGTLTRIDERADRIVATIELGKVFWLPLQFADGSVWTMGEEDGVVKRIDPVRNTVIDEFSIGAPQENGFFKMPFKGGLYRFAIGEGMLWVADDRSAGMSVDKYVVSQINPRTHERIGSIELGASNVVPAIWNQSVWIPLGQQIAKLDPKTNRMAGAVFLPPNGRVFKQSEFAPRLIVSGDSLWAVRSGSPAILYRIQKKSSMVRNPI